MTGLGLVCAFLLGGGLGLERRLRGVRFGIVACAVAAGAGAVVGRDFSLSPLVDSQLFWPVALAACAVAIGYHLAATTRPGGWRTEDEAMTALVAATALGLLIGLGATQFAGLMVVVAIFSLGWRPLAPDTQPAPKPAPAVKPTVLLETSAASTAAEAPASTPGFELIDIRRWPEEGRNDHERRQKREEQRQGEQLAHSGGAGVA